MIFYFNKLSIFYVYSKFSTLGYMIYDINKKPGYNYNI